MGGTTRLDGKIVNLGGKFVTSGMTAPDFKLTAADLKSYSLANDQGKRLLLNIFPSIDTPTCASSVRNFNRLAAGMHNTSVLCVSRDLPFAQSRFCGAEGIRNVRTLSDFHYGSRFGIDYGVLMTDGVLSGLFARAVVIIDESRKIIYTQMVEDIEKEPEYENALKALL